MAKKPNPMDVLRLGAENAAIKASMPRKRWKKFVKQAHKRGFSVAGALSGAPDPLKERTNRSLRAEAQKTVASAYKPVMKELTQREKAAGFLEDKRAADDAAYRQWTMGEVDKLTAQADAADATLAKQESDIASDLNASQQAAKTDSLQRVVAQPGNVSDPAQSTALDQTAADAASRERVANQRTLSTELRGIGDDADKMSRAAIIATAAVREATRTAENWKTRSEITNERTKARAQQAADASEMFQTLRAGEVDKAQKNREFSAVSSELGLKQADLAAEINQANREYGLKNRQFGLDKWIAENRATTEEAKLQLGYDKIKADQGKQAADKALRKWVERYKARKAKERQDDKQADENGPEGISDDERGLYNDVETARGLIVREHRRGTDPNKIRQKLRNQGASDVVIDVANDLWRNDGRLSSAGRQKARRLGITHVGYFW